MKVTVKTSTNEDFKRSYSIEVDGKVVFSVWDGEPEDNNLGRNFKSVYGIPTLLELMNTYGRSGGTIEIEYVSE